MIKVVESSLTVDFEFFPYSITRPAKHNTSDNYGYGAILRGGMWRLLASGMLTVWHLTAFPFALMFRRPSVVQVQASDFVAFWDAALYVLMCRAMRCPVIMRIGGSFDYFFGVSSPWARVLIRSVLKWPDLLIVQSEYWKDLMSSLGRRRNVMVLPNWVSDDTLRDQAERKPDLPVCLFSGGTEATRKGVDDVISAMKILQKECVGVHLHILGASNELRQRLLQENLGEMTSADGYVSHDRAVDAMRQADIFLLPSRGEGFPNALLEAMATGLPSVVTPVGAIPEIVGHDGAIVVPTRDSKALATAIRSLVEDEGMRKHIGDSARSIVCLRYTEAAVLSSLEVAWRSLLPWPRKRAL